MPARPRRTDSVAKSSPSTACSVVPASTTRTSPARHCSKPAKTGTRSADAVTVTTRPTMRRPWLYGRSSRGRMRSALFASERLAASSCHTCGGIPRSFTKTFPFCRYPLGECTVHRLHHMRSVRRFCSVGGCHMPKLRVHNFSVSVDGFGAGHDQSLDNPLGVRGEELHNWALATRTFRKMFG